MNAELQYSNKPPLNARAFIEEKSVNQDRNTAVRYKQVREEGMAGRKSYLEASYGCAKNMKETGTLLVQSVSYK